MWVCIDGVNITLSTIEINCVEAVIEPIYPPLILVSDPTHRSRQASKSRNPGVTRIVVPHSLYNYGITTHIAVEPTNCSIISRSINHNLELYSFVNSLYHPGC